MAAATILFVDIVGFSRKPTHEQKQLVEALTIEVLSQLRTLLQPPFQSPELVALPTGDGMALSFLHTPGKSWNLGTLLSLIKKLQHWAGGRSDDVALRIGLHVGTVEIITDINGHPNVCGDTINYTQRVMDAANPRQVLLSDAAFREYFGHTAAAADMNDLRIEGPLPVFAKHGLQIPVYKMTGALEHWENADPVAKGHLLMSQTPLPKEIVGSFSDRPAHRLVLNSAR